MTAGDTYEVSRGGYVRFNATSASALQVQLPGGQAGSAGDDADAVAAGANIVLGPMAAGDIISVQSGAGVIRPVDKIT